MLKAGGAETVKFLTHLIKQIWEKKSLPQDWKDGCIVPIHKKGAKAKCDNYRGISLLSIPGKVLTRVIYNRLVWHVDEILSESQAGFRSGRSTIDMMFTTRQLIEKAIEQNTKLCISFVDISKAFDSIHRSTLFKILEIIKCPPNMTAILKELHTNTRSRVKTENSLTDEFEVQSGVRQGCIIAPMLFILYMHVIISNMKNKFQRGVNIQYRNDSNMFSRRGLKAKTKVKLTTLQELMFADDCALIAETPEDLQQLINAFSEASSELGLHVNIPKTQCMFVNCEDAVMYIQDQELENVHAFKYLGSFAAVNGSPDTAQPQRQHGHAAGSLEELGGSNHI
ncbi:hypothetical protein M8J77_010417 [Diaphorina citri]|nr:hypothetical protein M8J77_010417 [Diaphorina citri]